MSGGGVLGAVLAGGASRRMGRDKAALEIDGVRLIDRAVAALEGACAEVVVVSSRPDTPAGRWRIVPDRRASCGPLGGLETALAEARDGRYDAVAVLAVDLPAVGGEAVTRLVRESGVRESRAPGRRVPEGRDTEAPPPRAAAAGRDGDPPFEPLCAVYPVSALETATRLLDEGARAARDLFTALDGHVVDDVAGAGVNVNRPEDLAAARTSAER